MNAPTLPEVVRTEFVADVRKLKKQIGSQVNRTRLETALQRREEELTDVLHDPDWHTKTYRAIGSKITLSCDCVAQLKDESDADSKWIGWRFVDCCPEHDEEPIHTHYNVVWVASRDSYDGAPDSKAPSNLCGTSERNENAAIADLLQAEREAR
jgi:hypothetical protein